MTKHESGFSAVELLITLFIAAIFLVSGYQLWGYVNKSGEESDQFAKASNISYDYLRRYSSSTSGTCAASTPVSNTTPDNSSSLTNAKVTVTISCPNTSVAAVSKITSTVTYGGNPVKSVIHAVYTN